MKHLITIGSLVLVLLSCGLKKKAAMPTAAVNPENSYILKFHEGVRLKSKGQIQEAIIAFEESVALKSADAPMFALYELYMAKNEKQKAGDFLQKAYKLDSKNIHYTTELAFYHLESGNFEKAVDFFKNLTKLQPRNPDFQYALAEALVKSGKPEEAIQALNKTQDQVGAVPELYIQKYNLYRQAKKPELAIKELQNGLIEIPGDIQILSAMVDFYLEQKQDNKAFETLEKMATADPKRGQIQLFLADVYRRNGEMDKYFKSLNLAFDGEGVDMDQKMKVLISLQEQKLSNDARAMNLVRELVRLNPTEGKPYTILGDYYIERQQEDSALVAYKNALSYEKSAFAIWQQVMIMQYQAGKFEELYLSTTECLQYFTNLPLVYLLKGVASNQLKKNDEAIQNLSIGIEFVVNDLPMKAEMYGQLGDAYFMKKEVNEGKSNYESGLKLDPQSLLLKNNYAYRLALAKTDLEKALGLIKSVNDTKPNVAHFMDTYGWVYFQKGDFDNAKEWFGKAFNANSTDKIIVEHQGDINFKLNNTEEAIRFWKKAKELGSTNQMIDKKIENLQYYDPIF